MKYSFLAAVNATTSISKFWFEIDEGNGTPPMVADNGGTGYTIDQDRVLFDHARSSHYDSDNLGLKGYRIVAAVCITHISHGINLTERCRCIIASLVLAYTSTLMTAQT